LCAEQSRLLGSPQLVHVLAVWLQVTLRPVRGSEYLVSQLERDREVAPESVSAVAARLALNQLAGCSRELFDYSCL
jgi:hypothetical protein